MSDITMAKVKKIYEDIVAIEASINREVEKILASENNAANEREMQGRTRGEWRRLLADALEARTGFFGLLEKEVIALKSAKHEIRAEALSTLGEQLNRILDNEWRSSKGLANELLSGVVVDFKAALQNDVVGPAKASMLELRDLSATVNYDVESFRADRWKSQLWITLAGCVATGTVVGVIVGHLAK